MQGHHAELRRRFFRRMLELRPDSVLGVPGLMSAVRAGTVTLANAVGNGVADDKGVYPYVPALIEYYLGEPAILPNVPTYLPWEPDQLAWVLDHLDDLVVKPVAEAVGGKGGGRPDFAQAGGSDASALDKALASVPEWVAENIG